MAAPLIALLLTAPLVWPFYRFLDSLGTDRDPIDRIARWLNDRSS